MPITAVADQSSCGAQEMRRIAEGIWDHQERASLMQFINDYERLAREVKAKYLGVTLPSRSASYNNR